MKRILLDITIWLAEIKRPVTLDKIAEEFDVSKKSVQQYLDKIDTLLREYNMNTSERIPGRGIKLDLTLNEKEKIVAILNPKIEEVFSKNERELLLIFLVYVNSKLTINDLMNILGVSRSTVNNDIRSLKEKLSKKAINYHYNIKKGS